MKKLYTLLVGTALCASPLAKGLFRRVLLESSTVVSAEPPHSFRLLDEALESGADLKERYGASSVADLRALSADDLIGEAFTQHHITVDGYVLSARATTTKKRSCTGTTRRRAVRLFCSITRI